MKMLLFGWLLKGHCEVTLLDEIIGAGFFLVLATLVLGRLVWRKDKEGRHG